MNDLKIKLLDNLKYDTYCRIGVSKIHGIGVIAIRNIPKGTNPFVISDKKCLKYNCIELTKNDMEKLSPPIRNMIIDFIASNKKGSFCVPLNGFNSLDISFYMNHSYNNNVNLKRVSGCEFLQFITNRNIYIGDELTINYKDFNYS
jgi:SET domain-containing protein